MGKRSSKRFPQKPTLPRLRRSHRTEQQFESEGTDAHLLEVPERTCVGVEILDPASRLLHLSAALNQDLQSVRCRHHLWRTKEREKGEEEDGMQRDAG